MNTIFKHFFALFLTLFLFLGCKSSFQKNLPPAPEWIEIQDLDAMPVKPTEETPQKQREEEKENAQEKYNSTVAEWRKSTFLDFADFCQKTTESLANNLASNGIILPRDQDGMPSLTMEIARIKEEIDEFKRQWETEIDEEYSGENLIQKLNSITTQEQAMWKFSNFELLSANKLTVSWDDWQKQPTIPPSTIIEASKEEIHDLLYQAMGIEKRLQNAKTDIEEKYKLLKKNEKIEFFMSRGGKVSTEHISGFLRNITQEKVLVGTHYLSRRDLPQEIEARIYPDTHEQVVKRELEIKTRRINAEFENALDEKLGSILPQKFYAAGYIPNILSNSTFRVSDVDNWISKYDFVIRFINSEKKEQMEYNNNQKITDFLQRKNYTVSYQLPQYRQGVILSQDAIKFLDRKYTERVEKTRKFIQESKAKLSSGWFAISDAKEKYGCKLITCIEAQLLEKQEITARMQDLGFSPETYIRDTSFWTPFMETYKRTWLQVKYDSSNPISESDTSYLD